MAAIEGLGSVSSRPNSVAQRPGDWLVGGSFLCLLELLDVGAGGEVRLPGQYDGAHFRVLRHPERLAELGGELVG